MPFPYVAAAGSPAELGRQHGRQAAAQIAGFLDYLYRLAGRPRAEVLQAALRFLPLLERYCPTVLEEVRGLAEGAELTLAEALLLQVRGEVLPLLAEGCTTFALSGGRTRGGGILIGQNSDMEPELEQYFLVLRLEPDYAPAVLMWTFAGQLGYHGLNARGVAHFANNVAGGPPPTSRPGGLPHYPVKRRLYECSTRAEVLAMWGELPVCSSGNYMIAAGDPAVFDVEATPAGIAVLEAGDGLLAHANHFLHPRFRTAATDAAALRDSFRRQERMEALLAALGEGAEVVDLMRVLADHEGHPCSICRHEEPGPDRMSTVAGLIAEPAAGRLHVSQGPPCAGYWTTYSLQARG